MNRNFRKVFVLLIVVVLSCVYIGCSSASKKDPAPTTPQHGQGGGCGH